MKSSSKPQYADIMSGDSYYKEGASWAAIVVMLFVFFPVAFIMMIVKLHREKFYFVSNGKAVAGFGWAFIIIAVFYAIGFVSGAAEASDNTTASALVFVIILLFCGYLLIRHGRKYKKLGMTYEKYMPFIWNSASGSIEMIAASAGTPFDTVLTDIQKLINIGLFPGSYIDAANNLLVSPMVNRGQGTPIHATTSPPLRETTVSGRTVVKPVSDKHTPAHTQISSPSGNTRTAKKAIKCPNCGGANMILECTGGFCEYCGSPIES